jgi:pentatricopeptide repeat protein
LHIGCLALFARDVQSMSTNAASLRRILRSIGSHATPATSSLKRGHVITSHLDTLSRHASTTTAAPTKHDEAPPATDASLRKQKTSSVVRKYNSAPPEPIDVLGESKVKPTTEGEDESKPTLEEILQGSATLEGEIEDRPTLKEGLIFRKQYFDAHKSDDKHRMKQRARRHLLSKQRSEMSEKQAWRDILRILDEDSPADAEHYIKRMETIRLPEGIFAQWIRDPGESILEVMQRTGSHVQVKPTKEIAHFSSITLLGTSSQNAAAKKLLQESDLLSAISEDDLNASKNLADYHLRSEIGRPFLNRKNRVINDIQTSDDLVEDELNDFDLSKLEDAVSLTIGQDQTRAVWSKPSTTALGESFRVKGPKGHAVIGTTKSAVPSTAIAFTARIEQLTADRPHKLWTKGRRATDAPGLPLKDELVTLMTNPDYAPLITPVAARMVLRYLAKHMYFPAVREILNALKDGNRQLDPELFSADTFNTLLDAAARHENVVAFHYIVNTMRERSVSPNPGTWIAFHTLMLKRYPGDSDKVLQVIKAKSLHAEPSVAIENLEAFSSELLLSFMRERPKASIKEFINSVTRDVAGVRWLTTFSANAMCHTLLKRGEITRAFAIVDELVRRRGRPDAVTLNIFLTAAQKDGHLPLAVAILRKFQDLHTNSIALASTAKNPITLLPRAHDLSITPDGNTFKILFSLAWDHGYMNCTRIVWRYACCAGHAHTSVAQQMKTSVTSQGARKGFVQTEDVQVSPRRAMWDAWAAKFAMGVKAGLGPVHAAEVLRIVGHSAAGNDTEKDSIPNTPNQLAARQARRNSTYARRNLITADRQEVQSLKPVRSLAEMVEEAWRMDREWKEKSLGLPKGLSTYGNGDAMFELMLKEGIEVPVEIGDGVGLTL